MIERCLYHQWLPGRFHPRLQYSFLEKYRTKEMQMLHFYMCAINDILEIKGVRFLNTYMYILIALPDQAATSAKILHRRSSSYY